MVIRHMENSQNKQIRDIIARLMLIENRCGNPELTEFIDELEGGIEKCKEKKQT